MSFPLQKKLLLERNKDSIKYELGQNLKSKALSVDCHRHYLFTLIDLSLNKPANPEKTM